MASPPGLEHQAALAPHVQGPAPPPGPRTPARMRAHTHTRLPASHECCTKCAVMCGRAFACTQGDGIFRPPALRWVLVVVDSLLGFGTGQSGSSTAWWGKEGSPHPRACSCMRSPAQPNPTQPCMPSPGPPLRRIGCPPCPAFLWTAWGTLLWRGCHRRGSVAQHGPR